MSALIFAFATFAVTALFFFVPRVGCFLLAAGACCLACFAVRDAEALAAVVVATCALLFGFVAFDGPLLSRRASAPRRATEEPR